MTGDTHSLIEDSSIFGKRIMCVCVYVCVISGWRFRMTPRWLELETECSLEASSGKVGAC